MSVVDSVVSSINAILKTLECSICLELLITPVTTGCGHFFCKFCITEVLKSNYRSPCPLCKRSFTRRSIQEAHQRQSVIVAAKELAEACSQCAGVKFSAKETKKDNSSCVTPSTKSIKAQESSKTSCSKKRKSYENNEEAFENVATAAKSKEKDRRSIGNVVEALDCVSSNDEVIPSTNKRHRQSNADSDDDLLELPSLEEIMRPNNAESKVTNNVDVQFVASKRNSKEFPVVRIERVTDLEISSKCNLEKIDTDVSQIPDSDIPKTATLKKEKDNKTESTAIKHGSGKASRFKRKMPVNNRESKLRSKVIDENEKNTLKNKTNQLNQKEKNALGKPLEQNIKNIEKNEEYDFNDEDVIKENKEMHFELYASPVKSGAKKNLSSSPSTSKNKKCSKQRLSKRQNKNGKGNVLSTSSSTEEDILNSNLKEVENFNLVILNNSKRSSETKTEESVIECYSLKEINLPPLKVTSGHASHEPTCKPQNANLQLDEIADTAVSVQTVASPEASKVDLIMKSPGWSKVKQVGKDFRVKKFSRLHVEKNTSNSCPLEAINVDFDSVIDNIPLTSSNCQEKPMKVPDSADADKSDICHGNERETTSNIRQESAAFSEKLKSFCKIAKANVVSAVDANEDCSVDRCNDELNEMPTLVNGNLVVSDKADIDHNNHETKFPTPLNDDSKVSGTFEFHVSSTDEMLLPDAKKADKNEDIDNEIASVDVLNCYDTNATALPVSNKIKNILASQAFQMQTDENPLNENYNLVNIPSNLQLPAINTEGNFSIESMEIDGINVGMNVEVSSFHQKGGSCDLQKSALHESNLVENASDKQNIRDVQAIELPKFVEEKDILSKYKETEKELVNVHYTEHAQQTSQRLLDFCDNNRQHKAFASLYAGVMQPNMMFKQKELIERSVSMLNQPEKFSTTMFKTSSAEKTKVLKRTCLTLEEIQEAFVNSNASGNPETICSLPFLCGDFKLNVCVSEETLNISVVKVVETDVPHNIQTRGKTLLLCEKNVQTSNNNSPVPSPSAVLPSSNVESDASQPDSQPKGDKVKKKINPYPYLSEYFSDSERSEHVVSVMKETPLNDSEVIPFMGPTNIASELSKMQGTILNKENVYASNVNLPTQIKATSQDDFPTNLEASQNLPSTQPRKEIASNICDILKKKEEFLDAPIGKETISPVMSTTSYVGRNVRRGSKSPVLIKSYSNSEKLADEKKSVEKSENLKNSSPTFEKKNSDAISFDKSTTSAQINYQEIFDDSDGFSSDPDMAYAMDLVAPLKDIAEKIEAAEKKEKSYQAGISNNNEFPTTRFSYASKEKNPIETFEELILSKNKDVSQSSSFNQKKSRLSLKSKKNGKKFKRIQTCDSDNDSDGFESSNNESVLVSNTSRGKRAKEKFLDKPQDPQKPDINISSPKDYKIADSSYVLNQKSHGDSLQDNSTFNSCLSEDITNNSNDIAMEIEDLDKKILSVVEKLKQCGHENLLKEKETLLKTPRKDVKLIDNYKSCGSSPGSEDSTDIFSQSVPPTPEKTLNSSDSVFKSVAYNQK